MNMSLNCFALPRFQLGVRKLLKQKKYHISMKAHGDNVTYSIYFTRATNSITREVKALKDLEMELNLLNSFEIYATEGTYSMPGNAKD